MIHRIPVFYRPEMVARNAGHYSPSAGKPAPVVADWVAHGLPIKVASKFNPAPRSVLKLAHDSAYVDGVLDGKIDNGFGNRDPGVARSLPYTTGSLLAAAALVVNHHDRLPIACSPTSGFHHAGHAGGGGFCTFNGLVAVAMTLKAAGRVRRVGILDCDRHYGDGTDDIIERLNLDWIVHWSAGANDRRPRCAPHDPPVWRVFQGCDLLLYQAGADPHVDDPLGGLLTTEQMRRRDRKVFFEALHYGIPLVWNLAGGYQRDADGGIGPVLALHRQTMRQCADVLFHGGSASDGKPADDTRRTQP